VRLRHMHSQEIRAITVISLHDAEPEPRSAPDVNGGCVLGIEGPAKLRRAVPTGGHIVSPKNGCWHVVKGCA